MKHSYKLQSVFAIACYALILLASVAMIVEMTVMLKTDDPEGLAGAVVKIVYALLRIIGGLFAIASMIPLSMRLLALRWRFGLLPRLCILFDLLFFATGVCVVVDGILDGEYEPTLYVIVGVMIVICMVILGWLISKMKIAQALKLGED